MALALYMDHHVPRAVTIGLRLRGAFSHKKDQTVLLSLDP